MKHALCFVAMMWREERRWLLAGAAASFFALLSATALLALSGWFITAAGLAGIAGAGLTFDFFRPSAGIRFLALFRTATRYGERLATHDATLRFLASLRATLFSSLSGTQKLSPRLRHSELLQRLTADLEVIDSLYLRLLIPAVIAVSLSILMCIVASYISLSLCAAISLSFLAGSLTIYVGALAARRPARRLVLGTESLRVRVIDLVHAQTDLLLSGGLASQKARIARSARYLSEAGSQLTRLEIAVAAALSVTAAVLTASIVLLGGSAFEAAVIDGPAMAMLVIGGFAALEIFPPLRRGAMEFGRIAFAGRRLGTIAANEPSADNRIITERGPAVAALGLTYRHGANAETIFNNFYFTARLGERVAIVGRSGCGKSTLLSLIAGLLQSESGNILINTPDEKRAQLGLLTQKTELFKGSIAENLRIAAPHASDRELWQVLEVVELRDKVEGLEGRLAWQLGECGNGFSGGECRRLALARLVLRNPRIWLMDEPTAGMDEALAERVLANLQRFASGATWIIAAHHDREIALAHRIVRIDGQSLA